MNTHWIKLDIRNISLTDHRSPIQQDIKSVRHILINNCARFYTESMCWVVRIAKEKYIQKGSFQAPLTTYQVSFDTAIVDYYCCIQGKGSCRYASHSALDFDSTCLRDRCNSNAHQKHHMQRTCGFALDKSRDRTQKFEIEQLKKKRRKRE
jgi:hypothetical protein